MQYINNPAGKKQQHPARNTIENLMDLMVIMWIILLLMETIMAFACMWWIIFVGCCLADKFYWNNAQKHTHIFLMVLGHFKPV